MKRLSGLCSYTHADMQRGAGVAPVFRDVMKWDGAGGALAYDLTEIQGMDLMSFR